MYVGMYVYMYVCMYVSMYVCVYVSKYVVLFNLVYLCFVGCIIEAAEGESYAQPTSISSTVALPWRSAAPSPIHVPPQPVTLGDVCSILNKEDNSGETSDICMCSKSLVHTFLHSVFFCQLM